MMTYTQLSNTEPYLIIHADGRITVSEKLQPSETAARVLECMKAQWMEDSQSKQIRELNQRIKQLEEMYEGEPGERPDLLGSNVMGLLKRELNSAQQRIKRLEDSYAAKDAQLSNLLHICRDNDIEVSSYDLIHRKEAKL